ncbi:hypothetical protein H4Q32_010501 [Labeo rohita]|uniref:Uncharacterized protein n=1 Tax=Labeo rohita TaxID=84645 RepID=A0ABQ8MV62_LABRO|nr:hypothetical protein H4Q32_010501 [Labeo rohita]
MSRSPQGDARTLSESLSVDCYAGNREGKPLPRETPAGIPRSSPSDHLRGELQWTTKPVTLWIHSPAHHHHATQSLSPPQPTSHGQRDCKSRQLSQLSLVDEAREREDEKTLPTAPLSHKFPHTHPLLSPPVILASSALPPLIPVNPSPHPQPTICAVGSLRVCLSPLVWLEDPLSLPWPVDPMDPPCLLGPSLLPWFVCLPALLGSLIPLTLLWSVVDHPQPRDSTPPATPCPSGSIRLLLPSGSTLVLCRSGSSLALRILCVTLAHRLSVSTIFHLFHCHRLAPWKCQSFPHHGPFLLVCHESPAPPLSVSLLESSALPPLWLLPPSAPLLVAFMAVAWVLPGSSCSKSLLSFPTILPPSGPPWFLRIPLWLLPPSSPPRLSACPSLSLVTTPDPLLCPPSKSPFVPPFVFPAPSGRGVCHTTWNFSLFSSLMSTLT